MSMARYHLRGEVAAGHPQITVALGAGRGLSALSYLSRELRQPNLIPRKLQRCHPRVRFRLLHRARERRVPRAQKR